MNEMDMAFFIEQYESANEEDKQELINTAKENVEFWRNFLHIIKMK